MLDAAQFVSIFAIPVFIVFILGYGYFKGVPVYEVFVDGAKEGLGTALKILPYLVAMFAAIGVFRASGAMDLLIRALSPVTNLAGIPPEILPLALMRPMSGSASAGMLAELFKAYGPDSFIGRTASTMMGSTETVFYTVSVYFGSVGIKKIRYVIAAGLIADLAGLLASVAICSLIFGR
jgi:spore maturation protein B